MNEPLRPMNLGEVLDRALQLYRSRFLVFLGISVFSATIVWFTAYSLAFLLARFGSSRGAPGSHWAELLASLLEVAAVLLATQVLLGAAALAMGAMCHAASRAQMGDEITIRNTYRAICRRGWRYLWLLTLQGLILMVAPLATWIALSVILAAAGALLHRAGMASAETLFVAMFVLVFVALIGFSVWMLFRLSLAFPACVIEEIGAGAALKRSVSLCKEGADNYMFGLYLLTAVLSWVLFMGITLTLMVILAQIPSFHGPQHAQSFHLVMDIAQRAVGFAVLTLILPIYGIALTLLYYDRCVRLEGYDIERMMEEAGMTAPSNPPSADRPIARAAEESRP